MLLAVHPGSEETTAPRSPARALTGWDATLLIVLTAGIAYSNSFAVPFQFDDAVALTGNPAITGFHLDPRGRRILGDLSFAASYRLFGDRPLGYHVVNVAIHVANALLVFWLVRSLVRSYSMRRAAAGGRDTAIAVVAAVLFAVHPMQTQAVTYIVQRYASLAAGFFLLACCSYVRFRLASSARASFAWYALFLASSLAAFETKESALVLPLAILLLELVFFSATARRRLLFFSPFLLGAAAAAGLALASGLTLTRPSSVGPRSRSREAVARTHSGASSASASCGSTSRCSSSRRSSRSWISCSSTGSISPRSASSSRRRRCWPVSPRSRAGHPGGSLVREGLLQRRRGAPVARPVCRGDPPLRAVPALGTRVSGHVPEPRRMLRADGR